MEELLFTGTKTVVSWSWIFWYRCSKPSWNDNREFRILHKISFRVWQDWLQFWNKFYVLEVLPNSITCYEEILCERKNWCGKSHCCLILRNCHSYHNLQPPSPWSVNSHQHQTKPSTNKKITAHLRLKWLLALFSIQIGLVGKFKKKKTLKKSLFWVISYYNILYNNIFWDVFD
jgi:hypothetical protein